MTLSPRQQLGLTRIGEALIPAEGDLPGFGESGCLVHIDAVLRRIAASDAADIRRLTTLCGVMPGVAVRVLLRLITALSRVEGPAGTVFWRIDVGIRALVMTLYYAHDPVLARLGYDIAVEGDIP